MKVRLRQIVVVAEDIAATEHQIESELGVNLCFRDPGVGAFGLVNALYPIGDKLLEVVSPEKEGTTAGRLLDKRGGDGGYMVIFQTDDLDTVRERIDETGMRIVTEAEHDGIVGIHLHPRDIGGAIVSVDQTDDWAAWQWAGPEWQDHVDTSVVSDVVGVEVHADDPADMAARWASILGGELEGTTLHLDEGSVRFTPAGERGEGVAGYDLESATGETRELEIAGTTFRLV